jgi:hypothetical protein
MNRDTEELIEHTVPVGPHTSSGYPEWRTFRGTKIGTVPCIMEDSKDFGRTRTYTLYLTPDEGLRIHEMETIRRGSMERRPGQRAAELEEGGCWVFSEEELRRERPEVAELILERF